MKASAVRTEVEQYHCHLWPIRLRSHEFLVHLDMLFTWLQVSITPIKDSSGFVTNFVGVLQDVTERKASEAAFKLRDHALSNLSEVHKFCMPCTYD